MVRGPLVRTTCRNKRRLIIRVDQVTSSLQSETSRGRLARRSRGAVSVVVLAASLAALALIVHDQRAFWFGQADDELVAEGIDGDEESAERRAAAVSEADDHRYRALSDSVARRYRVSQDMAYDLVHLAHTVGQQHGLDPLLIISIIAIESRFNPVAESMNGAKGLMQIIPKYHAAKLAEYGGEKALFDPTVNVKIGSWILKDYIRLTGNLGVALQMYAGALCDGEEQVHHQGHERETTSETGPAAGSPHGVACLRSFRTFQQPRCPVAPFAVRGFAFQVRFCCAAPRLGRLRTETNRICTPYNTENRTVRQRSRPWPRFQDCPRTCSSSCRRCGIPCLSLCRE